MNLYTTDLTLYGFIYLHLAVTYARIQVVPYHLTSEESVTKFLEMSVGQNEWISKAEDIADRVSKFRPTHNLNFVRAVHIHKYNIISISSINFYLHSRLFEI